MREPVLLMKKTICSVLICLAVLGWALMAGAAETPDTVTLTAADQGKTVEVRVGQTIRIELAGNPSTGYDWHPVQVDTQYLDVLSTETEEPANNNLVGAPGMIITPLKAKKPGTTTIELGYFRVWEGAGQAADHFRFNLVIKP